MKDPVRERVRAFIVREFLGGRARGAPGDATPLFGRGIVDSLGVFVLVRFLEEEFGVRVLPREVTPRHFADVRSIARLVSSKKKGARGRGR